MEKHHHEFHKKHNKWLIAAFLVGIIAMVLFFHDFKTLLLKSNFQDSGFILIYLPGFFLLMGLIEAWLPTKFIAKHVGNHSGWKGSLYSFVLGSLMIGPLYLAFPISVLLLKKGISKYNVALFIGAWSVFPIGQEIFEIQFMGLRFFILRAALSIVFVILISLFIKYFDLVKGFEEKKKNKI